jgi:hypothetical protein
MRVIPCGAVAAAVLACGCGAPQRASTRPEDLLGTPPAGYRYQLADRAYVKGFMQRLEYHAGHAFEARDVAVRNVVTGGRPVGIVLVIDTHGGSQEDVFRGFTGQAERTGDHAMSTTVAGADAKQVEVKGLIETIAVRDGFILETIAANAGQSERFLRRLLQRASTVSD